MASREFLLDSGEYFNDAEEASLRQFVLDSGVFINETQQSAGGDTVDVNQASETDSAQSIARSKVKTFGQVSESDAVQTIVPNKVRTIGQCAESDSVQIVVSSKVKSITQATETDTAQTVTRGGRVVDLAQVTETDTSQAITWAPKHRLVSQVSEVDSAQLITAVGVITVPLEQVVESDSTNHIHRKPYFVQSAGEINSDDEITEIAATFSSPVKSGNSVVGFAIIDHVPFTNILGIDDDQGNEYVIVDYLTRALSGNMLLAFYKHNITNGPVTVTVHFSLTSHNVVIVHEYGGLGPLAGVELAESTSSPPGSGTDQITSPSVTATRDASMVVGAVNNASAASFLSSVVAGTNYTARHFEPGTGAIVALKTEDRVQDAAASVAATWTDSTFGATLDYWRGVIVFGPREFNDAVVAQVSESDTAQLLTRVKTKSFGQISETDSGQAITARKVVTLGQSSETDTAQIISRGGVYVEIGQVSETDSNQAITARKSKTLGINSETDEAQPVLRSGQYLIAQATESDNAQPFTVSKVKAFGIVTETDSPGAFTSLKVKSLGINSETDSAQTFAWSPKKRLVNYVEETDEALVVTPLGGMVVVPSTSRGGAGYRPNKDAKKKSLKIRHLWDTTEDEVGVTHPVVPTVKTPKVTPEDADVFTISISERSEEVRQQILTQLLKAYKVDRVEDLPSIGDEEEVLTLVQLALVKLQDMGRLE